MKTKETRSATLTAAGDMRLEGYPVVFETPTTIHSPSGDYVEIIHRGALDECDMHDSTLIYNHDDSRIPLARSGRTMSLEVDGRGLHMVATLAGDSQQAREVYTSIKRGDLQGMSFSFVVPDGGSRYDGQTNTRHIHAISKIYECSITPWPAYPQTSVEARDAMGAARDAARQDAMRRAARITGPLQGHKDKEPKVKFENVAEAYALYKSMSIETLESRAKGIQADIAANPAADMQAYNIELEAIESALTEKRGDKSPEPEKRAERPEHPGFTAADGVDKNRDDPRASAAYRSAFYKHLVGNDLTAEERRAFDLANAEKRNAFNNLTNAAAVVPTKLMDEIIVKARDHGGLLSISRGFNVPANVRLPIVTPGDPAEWHTEGALMETEKVDPTYVEFNAYEIMRVLSMSVAAKTMTLDTFESYLAEELSAAVLECLAHAMVSGDGNKKGTGILTGITWTEGENLLEIAGKDWLDWKMIPQLISMLHRHYATGARFVMSNETLYQDIITLHDDNNQPIYVYDLQNANTGRLMGFPVTIDDYMAPHDILFGNFKFMGYNLPQGLMLDVSKDSSFKSGLIDYRAMAVADCKPIITEPFVRMRTE